MHNTPQTNIPTSSLEEIIERMLAYMEETIGDSSMELIVELAPMFIEDTPPILNEIHEAAGAGDVQRLREAAHTLKGSSASMGFSTLSQHCLKLENYCKQNDLANAKSIVPFIEAEYKQIEQALKRYM